MTTPVPNYRVNTVWMLVERVVRIGYGAISLLVLARYLGPVTFGELNYALGLVSIASVGLAVVADTVLVRELVDEPGEGTGAMRVGFVARLAIGCLMGSVLVAAATVGGLSERAAHFQSVAAITLLFRSSLVVECWFQARARSRSTAIANALQSALSLALLFAFVAMRLPADQVIWLFVMEAALQALLLGVVYLRRPRTASVVGRERAHPACTAVPVRLLAHRMLRESLPLMLSSASIIVYVRLDQVMLMHLRGPEELGSYSLAARLSEIVYFVPAVVTAAFFPAMVEALREDREALLDGARRLLLGLVAFSLGFSALAVTASRLAIVPLFGVGYAGAVPVFAVLTWSLVFVSIGSVTTKVSIVLGSGYGVLGRTLLGAGCNVVLNSLLIPEFGGQGAAWASLVSYAVSGYFSLLLFPNDRILFALLPQALRLGWRTLLTSWGEWRRGAG